MRPLAEMAVAVLNTADGREKTALSRGFAAEWFAAKYPDAESSSV